jgi:hypothetical protein
LFIVLPLKFQTLPHTLKTGILSLFKLFRMKNLPNFLMLRRRQFAVFFQGIACLLLILVAGFTSCKSEVKNDNIQEVLLNDKVFKELATASHHLQKIWLEGTVRNPGIQSVDAAQFNALYEQANTDEERIQVLRDVGFAGDLSKQVELMAMAKSAEIRFKEKFPNLPEEEFIKAMHTYTAQELGNPDYSKPLKLRNYEN